MVKAALTLDTDWAPDFVIAAVAERLVAAGVRATWFITHDSPATRALRDHPDLFELGIHPNLLPGSSHGSDHAAVLDHCLAIVPNAVSMRTHALVQSTPWLYHTAATTSITHDVSLFLPHAPVAPHIFDTPTRPLVRVAYSWEDDVEMLRRSPCWYLGGLLRHDLTIVFDFHPIHVWLNSANMEPYNRLKAVRSRLQQVSEEEARQFRFVGEGTATALDSLIAARPEFVLIRELTV